MYSPTSVLTSVRGKENLPEFKAFRRAFELVNPHLYSVEERILQQAKKFDPAVEGYVRYVCDSGGKRLRPALTLLSAGATGKISSSHLDLAVILELIHVASLVHDDIMDGADLRRENPTANAKWGNSLSVLLGDALFAHALRLATGFENTEVCRSIADASVDVCSGEIIQTQRRFDLKLSLIDYYKIIEMKTAALFATACELSALLNGASPEVIKGMQVFGLKVGSAYQIYDDCVDLVGSEELAGKTLGTDLQKGKFTLPILVLLQQTRQGAERGVSDLLLNQENQNSAETLVSLIRETGALKSSAETATRMLTEAEEALAPVPNTEFRTGLLAIASYVKRLVGELQQ